MFACRRLRLLRFTTQTFLLHKPNLRKVRLFVDNVIAIEVPSFRCFVFSHTSNALIVLNLTSNYLDDATDYHSMSPSSWLTAIASLQFSHKQATRVPNFITVVTVGLSISGTCFSGLI
jgi:hypothetical protein